MLKTEMRNPRSTHIDRMTSREMVDLIASENYCVVKAVEDAAGEIAAAVDVISESFRSGRRLFFIGAGTSGRLGIMDAAECPPTYGVSPDVVTGIIAGGNQNVFRAGESAEDNEALGAEDIRKAGVIAGDTVVGISAAGGAAYVVGALKAAKEIGAAAIALTCNEGSRIGEVSDICIVTDTGAEIVTGSTRMKAGTAHKIVLNILTTCGMILNGKVYENMMVNLSPSNAKLAARMVNIVCEISGCDPETAENALKSSEWKIPRAVEALKEK